MTVQYINTDRMHEDRGGRAGGAPLSCCKRVELPRPSVLAEKMTTLKTLALLTTLAVQSMDTINYYFAGRDATIY